jgi:hypothetical protein
MRTMLSVSLRAVCALAACAALAPARAAAQTPEPGVTPLAPGVQSISFALPWGGGGRFGYWRMRDERRAIGWEVGVNVAHDRERVEQVGGDRVQGHTRAEIAVGPTFRRYMAVNERVVPFMQTGVHATYVLRRGSQTHPTHLVATRHGVGVRAAAGLGVEWFPVPRVGVNGFTGLSVEGGHGWTAGDGEDRRAWSGQLDTFTSGLALQIYLPRGLRLR